jgi:hypothetical protein
MLAPTMQATQAHQALEDAYGTLGMQAGTVEAMLNRELDEKAYNQYQGYMQGLQESADLLAREGLNPALRGSLSNLKSRYSQEIVPIQKAAERREKLADEQRQKGNNYIFDFDAATTGLDRFMDNPSLNYQSIDRKDLRARAENAFSKFQNELNEFKIDGNIDAYHKKLVQKYGYRPEEATDFINGVMNGDEASALDKSLLSIYNNLYNGTQVDSWNNPEASREVMNTILEGVSAAIGKTGASIMNDEEKLADLKYRNEIKAYRQKLQDKYNFDNSHKDPDYIPPIFRLGSGNLNLTKDQAALKADIDKYQAAVGYFKAHPELYEQYAKTWNEPAGITPGATQSGEAFLRRAASGGTHISKSNEALTHFINLMDLSKSLGSKWKNVSGEDITPTFNFSVDTDELGNKKFNYSSEELSNMMQDLGTMYKPMYYNVSEQGMKNIMRGVHTNVMSSRDADSDSKVGLMKTVDGKSVTRKELDGLDWDKSELFMIGDQEYVIFNGKADKGKVFRLEPGATGDFNEGALHKNISNYYNNRQFEDYFYAATDYMADVFGMYNSQHKGQTGTTKTINDIPSVSTYDGNKLYDFGYDYSSEEDEE